MKGSITLSDLTLVAMFQLLLRVFVFVEYLKDVNCNPIRGGNTEWLTKTLRYMESNPETLKELMNNDHAVIEGDVVLPSDRNAVGQVWPGGAVPYLISSEIENKKNDILSAMAMVSEHTCVSFHSRTTEPNYLLFKNSQGCASYVGFVGGEQPVFIGPFCITGNICHEILHALGFHHEHTRTDRRQFVTVVTQNIMEGMEKNFNELNGNTFNLPYDLTSILHYGRMAYPPSYLRQMLRKWDRGLTCRSWMYKGFAASTIVELSQWTYRDENDIEHLVSVWMQKKIRHRMTRANMIDPDIPHHHIGK